MKRTLLLLCLLSMIDSAAMEIQSSHAKAPEHPAWSENLINNVMYQLPLDLVKKHIIEESLKSFEDQISLLCVVQKNIKHLFRDETGELDAGKWKAEVRNISLKIKKIKDKQITLGYFLLDALEEKDEYAFYAYLALGPNLNVINESGDSVLMQAVLTKNKRWIVDLIKRGADVNAVNGWKETPITLAIKHGSLAVAKLLIEYGANVNYESQDDNITPLMLTAENQAIDPMPNIGIAIALIEGGAKVNAQDKGGATALLKALLKGNTVLAAILLERGALFDIPNNFGLTSIEVASTKRYATKVREYQSLYNTMCFIEDRMAKQGEFVDPPFYFN